MSMSVEVQLPVVVVAARSCGIGREDEVPLVGDRLLERAAHHPSFLLQIITVIVNVEFSKEEEDEG
jgi:hypothetical protein